MSVLRTSRFEMWVTAVAATDFVREVHVESRAPLVFGWVFVNPPAASGDASEHHTSSGGRMVRLVGVTRIGCQSGCWSKLTVTRLAWSLTTVTSQGGAPLSSPPCQTRHPTYRSSSWAMYLRLLPGKRAVRVSWVALMRDRRAVVRLAGDREPPLHRPNVDHQPGHTEVGVVSIKGFQVHRPANDLVNLVGG